MAPSGHTRVAGVIGDPVRHSLSPAIHNAAFTAEHLDWVYVAFPVPDGFSSPGSDGGSGVGSRSGIGESQVRHFRNSRTW